MKCLMYRRPDSVVAVGSVSQKLLLVMTTPHETGPPPAFVDREVAKFLIETKVDEASFKADWSAFLATKLGTPREIAIRAFVEGVAYGGLVEDEALNRIAGKDRPIDATQIELVEEALLPPEIRSDRYFRDAVVWDDAQPNKCRCDMPKARGVHMDKIRLVRNAELAAKDIPFMRAIEVGDTDAQATIGTEKQVLRDIPQTFDLTTDTPQELKDKWPSELPARE